MNGYDYILKFAEAVRDDSDILDYCVANWDKGLLVQIDDDNEDPVGSPEAPYCILMLVPGGDDSPVSENRLSNIRVEVGVNPASTSQPPYRTDVTERTTAANGLRKYGEGERALDLLDLVLTAIKAVNLGASEIQQTMSIDANGSLLFPLALAVSNISVISNKELNSFS